MSILDTNVQINKTRKESAMENLPEYERYPVSEEEMGQRKYIPAL